MSSLTSFPNFSDLPFKLRDLIWLFSLDELALSWKPRELGPLFYPLQQQNWQPRDATGQMSSPEEEREEAKERQLPLYQYRQRIPHFGVNGEARAAASSWASKQEAGWLAAHQGCVDPRRCATWFDGDRNALAQPRLFLRKTGGFSDGFFLSQAEYERCRDVLGCSRGGQHPPGTAWKLSRLWSYHLCEYEIRGGMSPPLAVPLALLRWDPDALKNIMLWDRRLADGDFPGSVQGVVVIMNELPNHGECMTVQDGWKLDLMRPIWKFSTALGAQPPQGRRGVTWRSDRLGSGRKQLIGAEAWSVIEHAISRLDLEGGLQIHYIMPMRAVRHDEPVKPPSHFVYDPEYADKAVGTD